MSDPQTSASTAPHRSTQLTTNLQRHPDGIVLPTYHRTSDQGHLRTPVHVTVIGVVDRTRSQTATQLSIVESWEGTRPSRQAPPVVAVLTPVRHQGLQGTSTMVTVHLQTVTITDDTTVHLREARFYDALVSTAHRRWHRHLSDVLGYPPPVAVRLWNHPVLHTARSDSEFSADPPLS